MSIPDPDDGPLSNDLLNKALQALRPHWERWSFCYERGGDFSDTPILTDPVRFQGFLYEFSVGRGLEPEQVVPIMEDLRLVAFSSSKLPIQSVLDRIEAALLRVPKARNTPDKWTRISLASKLLALWGPDQHPMWDRFVRKGLSAMFHGKKGHCYANTSVATYAVFRRDFHHIHTQTRGRLEQYLTDAERSRTGYSNRYLDQALLLLGKSLA